MSVVTVIVTLLLHKRPSSVLRRGRVIHFLLGHWVKCVCSGINCLSVTGLLLQLGCFSINVFAIQHCWSLGWWLCSATYVSSRSHFTVGKRSTEIGACRPDWRTV